MIKKIAFWLIPFLVCVLALVALPKTNAASANLITNPSVETVGSTTALPAGWNHDKWGTNTASFTYLSGGAHTGDRSLYVNMTNYTSGDAKWYFSHVSVLPNQKYNYSEFYKSNVATEIDVEYTTTTGMMSYGWLADTTPSATSWSPVNLSFTTPANVTSLTIFHLIDKAGWLQTDDFNLDNGAVIATPPSISLISPTNNATISGLQTIAASASDAAGVAGVQFKLDGINLGAEDITAPYSTSLDTKTIVNGLHTISATARNTGGLSTTVSETINVQNTATTAPSVNITAPAVNSVVSGTQTVSANATDSQGIQSVQFKLDGLNLGAADTTSPFSISWDTKTIANGKHTLTAVATNMSKLSTTSGGITIDVENQTAPTVSIISPTANATVSGTTALTANAASAQGVANVQFKLNGANLGSPITSAPYTMNWDSTKTANGTYSLTAVVTDKANLTATSAVVSFTNSNQIITPPPTSNNGPNLVANPSFEVSSSGTAPDSWLASSWGSNTTSFNYLSTGHSGTRSVKVQTTAYTNGAANWYYNDVPITPGSAYQYSNWYQSNVDTEVDAEVVMNDGTVNYYYMGTVLASPTWAKFTTTFTPPAGAKSMAAYQILAKVGYIISDDYSLNSYTPQPFNRALVSVSFDDGWTNQYLNAFPLLAQYAIPATFNIISGELTDQPAYMSGIQVKNLDAAGNEIASHTVTHPDLTTLSATKLQQEMSQSQATLQTLLGGKAVTDFAYPFGAYNLNTISVGKQYYISQRTVNAGTNTKDSFDLTQLKIHEVDSNVSQAVVQGWINSAIAEKSWLILVYHEIAVTPTDPTDTLYDTQPADLNAELAYLKNTGVATVTVSQAINEILPQF